MNEPTRRALICFLLAERFPEQAHLFARGRLAEDGDKPPDPTTDAIASYVQELKNKSESELRRIVAEAHARNRVRESSELELEHARALELCRNSSDFELWSKTPYWTAAEAAALILGIDPRFTERSDLKLPVAKMAEMLNVVERAQAIEDLAARIRPIDFIRWAAGRFELPEALIIAVRRNSRPAAETADGALHPKERVTLLKALLATAVAFFDFDPGELRPNSTAKRMAERFSGAGYRISDDTVRKYLNQAVEEIGVASD